ncbi:MAG: hypothetical protein J6V01_07030 [Clostridia bacterium]|nr:hypothetical protein [Clostridia bacterium]
MRRKTLILISVLLLFALAVAGCGGTKEPENGQELIGQIEKTAAFCKKSGDSFDGLTMEESAAYWYGYAGAALGSLRLAAEKILWLRGEGDSFASLAEGSRFTDFSDLERLSPSSPYAWYFDGLIYDVQGIKDEAEARYAAASSMLNYPDEPFDFHFLKDMPIDSLYSLRDRLRASEDELYEVFDPELSPLPADPVLGRPEYLISYVIVLTGEGKYEDALPFARELIRIAPFEEVNWKSAVLTAVSAQDAVSAVLWLREGLGYHPESKDLLDLKRSLDEGFGEE